jgi:ureidoglycolate hydrolase
MGKERVVFAQPLVESAIEVFGRAVRRETGAPPSASGAGWSCWFPLGQLHESAPLEIGLVQTEPRSLVVGAMERHPDREEWVYAIDQPLIQLVSLSEAADTRRPDPDRARAFFLQPGEGIIMARGTWHAPGFPATNLVTLYGFALSKPVPDSVAETEGWIDFRGGDTVRVQP